MSEVVVGIDTATPWLALALVRDGRVQARYAERLDRAIAGRLMPQLATFLDDHGVARRSLSAVAVGVGPGSYTGIRIGVAAALGIGRALGVRVVGGGTLDALALAALADGETGWTLLDARRERVHALRARRVGDALIERRELGVVALAALPDDGLPRYEGHAPDAAWHAANAATLPPPSPRYG